MKMTTYAGKIILRAVVILAISIPALACGPGTVYVGVAAPGPWVGYPPGGVYGPRPGYWGRPWYSPEPEAPQTVQEAPRQIERVEAASVPGASREGAGQKSE